MSTGRSASPGHIARGGDGDTAGPHIEIRQFADMETYATATFCLVFFMLVSAAMGSKQTRQDYKSRTRGSLKSLLLLYFFPAGVSVAQPSLS